MAMAGHACQHLIRYHDQDSSIKKLLTCWIGLFTIIIMGMASSTRTATTKTLMLWRTVGIVAFVISMSLQLGNSAALPGHISDWTHCEHVAFSSFTYEEICPDGRRLEWYFCNPGQYKKWTCRNDTSPSDPRAVCYPCPRNYFQQSFNNCTACHPCTVCEDGYVLQTLCSDEEDTVCIREAQSINDPPPDVTTTIPAQYTPHINRTTPFTTPSFTSARPLPATNLNQHSQPTHTAATANTSEANFMPVIDKDHQDWIIRGILICIIVLLFFAVIIWYLLYRKEHEEKLILAQENETLRATASTEHNPVNDNCEEGGNLNNVTNGNAYQSISNGQLVGPQDDDLVLGHGDTPMELTALNTNTPPPQRPLQPPSRLPSQPPSQLPPQPPTYEESVRPQGTPVGNVPQGEGQQQHREATKVPGSQSPIDPPVVVETQRGTGSRPQHQECVKVPASGGVTDTTNEGRSGTQILPRGDGPNNPSPEMGAQWPNTSLTPGQQSPAGQVPAPHPSSAIRNMAPLATEEDTDREDLERQTPATNPVTRGRIPDAAQSEMNSDRDEQSTTSLSQKLIVQASVHQPENAGQSTNGANDKDIPMTSGAVEGRGVATVDRFQGGDAVSAPNTSHSKTAESNTTSKSLSNVAADIEGQAKKGNDIGSRQGPGANSKSSNAKVKVRLPSTGSPKTRNPKRNTKGAEEAELQLLPCAESMATEGFLERVSEEVDLLSLDKICRKLGLEQKDVTNLKCRYGDYQSDRGFYMLLEILKKDGIKLTFGSVIKALNDSRNKNAADKLIEEFHIEFGN